jgi:hypothetical protein
LNNIADTNEPTSIAVKMHRALFDDGNGKQIKTSTAISSNLIQRKQETLGANNMEINKMFDVKTKLDDFAASPSVNGKVAAKFNQFPASKGERSGIHLERKQANRHNHPGGSAQSFCDFFKSICRCSASESKINEQIESDYPLNLHLRMNEIFSMHDKLSDIAENLNDLYSTGEIASSMCKLWDSDATSEEDETSENNIHDGN